MKLNEARKLCRWWQRQLRIQDWDIDVRLVHLGELLEDHALGRCDYFLPTKQAVVSLLHMEEVPRDWDIPHRERDAAEQVLVHELIHVVLAPTHPDDTPDSEGGAPGGPRHYHNEVEQAVHSLSRALVACRGGCAT